MNLPIFYAVMISFAVFSLLISHSGLKLLSRVDLSDHEKRDHYYLGNRSVGAVPLTLTFLATQLGGGAIIGTSEVAYQYGWRAIFYALGISIGLFVLSSGVGAKFRRLEVSTIPEIFSHVYKSNVLRKLAALIVICSMFCILVALGVATRKLFASLGFLSEGHFLLFWGIIIAYTTFGGFNAVVKTDILQISFVLLTFALAFCYIIFFSNFSLTKTVMSFPYKLTNQDVIPYTDYLLMPLFYTIIGQDMGQRCFSAKSPKVVTIATISAGILLTLCTMLPVIMGMFARSLQIELRGASVLVEVMQIVTTPAIASLFASSILIAILSTADSLICAISSNLSFDLISSSKPFFTKFITFIIGILAIILSFYSDQVLKIMVFSYEFTVCALFIPIMMSAIIQNPNYYCASVTVILGVFGFIVLKLFLSLSSYLLPLLLSLSIIYLLIYYFLKPTNQKR